MDVGFVPILIDNRRFLINTGGQQTTHDVLPAIIAGNHIDTKDTFKDGMFLIYDSSSENIASKRIWMNQ